MDWDDLRVLLAVARHGTMKGAARVLGVSHTTVSRRVETLERDAGVRLVRRVDRRLRLTVAGQALTDAAARMEDDLSEINRAWLGADARLSGSLRVTAVEVVALTYTDAFASFCEMYPDVELELSTSIAVVDLSRDADVALRMTTAPPEHLVGRRIAHWPYGIYGAESLLDAHPETALADMPWLGWSKHLGARVTEAWFKANAPDARFAARHDSTTLFIAMLSGGAGLGFIPTPIGDGLPGVRRVADAPDAFATDLWLLTHPDLRHAARVRALMNHLGRATPRIAVLGR